MWGIESRAARLAVIATLGAVLVTWNAVFDRGIDAGMDRYLALQRQAAARGSFVYMQDVMRPAAAESAVRASAWSAPVAGVGFVAAWWLGRRERRRRSLRQGQAR
ncbi:MAG TPA: hypothetical protein VNK41_06480 [Vicinamibacterales bacterium]|nr:hypothetical protein [Vicinamibacterales bacterium]